MSLAGRSLVSLRDWSRSEINLVLQTAQLMAQAIGFEGQGEPQPFAPLDRIMATLFFEPSTRTRLSFEAAMLRLGGQVIGFADPQVSSAAKGESLADAVAVISGYCDLIVIRHPLMGAAKVAADYGRVPVINAGDGPHEHPTQTLTDLFALQRAKGRLEGLRVGLCGDLKYGRTVHSLAPLLARFGCQLLCIAPEPLRMPAEVMAEVEALSGQRPQETEDLRAALPELDVLYMTRVQRERFPDPAAYERVKGVYVLTPELMAHAPADLIILHPLPRVDEIDPRLDSDPRAWYFRQAHGGVPVRMALIALLLGLEPMPVKGRRYGLHVRPAPPSPQPPAPASDLPPRELLREAPPCRQPGCVTAVYENLPAQAFRQPWGELVCAYCERSLPKPA
jgi:aspartate carbamoyltransferase catalytic subunit